MDKVKSSGQKSKVKSQKSKVKDWSKVTKKVKRHGARLGLNEVK